MRPLGRLVALAVALAVLFIVIAQYRGIIGRNVALAAELDRTRADVAALRARAARERRAILRLQSPEGAIPEIHDKLRMVGPHEQMIYLKGDVPATAAPDVSTDASDTP
jgi:hypothetical protein